MKGRLALDDPVDRHLRWFRIPRTGKRITIHHLLSHTAGITAGMEGTPEAVVQVWQLRHVRPGSAPGRHFHYSNVGYKTVGLLIEAIEGRPFPDVVQDRLLDAIGLAATSPAITHDLRPRMAIGYGPARDDRPFQPGDALAPVTWFETATADGGVAATAADLAAWMRWLMSGPDGYADRMIDVTGAPDSEGYGYAMWSFEVDGRTYRAHNGGMVGFLAGMQWDVEAGLGAVVLQNGMGRAPGALARLLTRQARAAREGRDPATELPEQGSWEALEAADTDDAEAAQPPADHGARPPTRPSGPAHGAVTTRGHHSSGSRRAERTCGSHSSERRTGPTRPRYSSRWPAAGTGSASTGSARSASASTPWSTVERGGPSCPAGRGTGRIDMTSPTGHPAPDMHHVDARFTTTSQQRPTRARST